MTLQEFSLEFNILYDNNSKGAPGLNDYEKSVFLTQAQEEIVKNYYSGFNETQQSFEKTENRRVELKELVVTYQTVNFVDENTSSETLLDVWGKITPNSKIAQIPPDVWYIIYERAKIDYPQCTEFIKVKPVTHDELNVSLESPFRKPNKRKVLRVDRRIVNGNNIVELVSEYPVIHYFMRYIKKPRPIILTTFENDPELSGLNLTVDGINVATTCELRNEIHRDILNRAVELAVRSYRENNLSNIIQTNNRVV